MEEAKETLKNICKKLGKSFLRMILPVLLVVVLIITLLAAATYYVFVWVDGIGRDEDWSSVPYATGEYINGTTISTDGKISSNMTAQELWDKMMENNSRVDLYLDSPDELAKIMNAEMVTKYPDTRPNPDEPIEWDKVNVDNTQGIIKFKRADTNGNTKTISYVSPDTFDYWFYEYNKTGSEEAKNNILSHFTLEKTSQGAAAGAVAAGDGVMTDVSQAIINAAGSTPSRGAGWCLAWVDDVYDNAGVTSVRYPSAYESWKHNGISTDMSAIPIGAAVYGTGSNSGGCGHVGIYIGGGQVMDNQGPIVTSDINTWLSWQTDNIEGHQGWLGWGWADGNKTRGTTQDPNVTENKTSNKDEEEAKKEDNTAKGTVTQESGDGYSQKYTSSTGFTYTDFKQGKGSYANNSYWDGTIASSGCGPTSVAILASGLTDLNYTPATTASQMQEASGYTGAEPLKKEMDSLGMTSEIINAPSTEEIQNQLKAGKVLLVSVESSTIFTDISHIMAVVDINEKGEVYILNPSNSQPSGWYDPAELTKGCTYIIATDSGKVGTATSQTSDAASYSAVVATWKQIDKTTTSNDPNMESAASALGVTVENSTTYTMTKTNINYEEMVEPYVMPFDMLWALLVMGEDKDFIFELVDLIYGSDIQITIHDNLTVNTDIDNWNYEYQTKVKVDGFVRYSGNGVQTERRVNNDIHDPEHIDYYNLTKTVVTQTNTVKVDLTRANVWIVDYQKDYSYVAPSENTSTSEATKEDEPWPETEDHISYDFNCEHIEAAKAEARQEWISKAQSLSQQNQTGETSGESVILNPSENLYMSAKYYYRHANMKDSITNTVRTQRYTAGTPTLKEKTDKTTEPNFVTIFNKYEYKINKSNIKSASSWFFEIIENNDGTADMLDLMKYLLYKATGVDYGVTEFDFSIFYPGGFSNVSGIYGNSIQEKVWFAVLGAGYSKEAAAGVMGNIEAESGFNADVIEGGSGIGGGLCQWSFGRRTQLELYAASKGTDWTDENTQIEFLIAEITPGGGANGYASYQLVTYNGYSPSDWENAATPEDAAIAFCWSFERPGIPRMDVRTEAARKYYNEFKDKKAPSADGRIGEIRLSGDNADKMKAMLTEALRIADDNRYQYSQAHRNDEFYYDCSSFVYRLYKEYFGIEVGNTTYDSKYTQGSNYTTNLSTSNLQPGDILWSSGHVALYIGNGQIVHAINESRGIDVTDMSFSSFERAYTFVK